MDSTTNRGNYCFEKKNMVLVSILEPVYYTEWQKDAGSKAATTKDLSGLLDCGGGGLFIVTCYKNLTPFMKF